MYNAILEWIHQVLGNLVSTCNITQTYVDKDDPCSFILAASSFAICSTTNRLKGYSPGRLLFGSDMILLINHKVDWGLIRQQKQTKINKDNICKNRNELTPTMKLEIKSCSIITLRTNSKRHIRAHL